ncbi:4-hydroxy-tetrahydrodipicolinate reductase [Buchnera aphidicola (Kurisakia onigurumii)]|uniref:4-hydroxy-tetrahydrodipicolinate reductase n=1 Tax=Buchnera aphidicola TaxID=9 RepID=UPI0031B6A28D
MITYPIKIAIIGALGKIGKILIKEIKKNTSLLLTAAIVKKIPHDFQNKIINKKIFFQIKDIVLTSLKNADFDVAIDFSNPVSTIKNLKICVKKNKKIIIGTTGFNQLQQEKINDSAKKIGIVQSSNFSTGINLIYKLLEITTSILGNNSDIEIIDSHHRNKIDSPSGTALSLGSVISQTMNINLNKNSIYRKKEITKKREKNKIGFSIIRAGNIIGEHTVMFANSNESIEITHKAMNRTPFVLGAIESAKWIHQKNKTGLYNMRDILKI